MGRETSPGTNHETSDLWLSDDWTGPPEISRPIADHQLKQQRLGLRAHQVFSSLWVFSSSRNPR